MPPIRIKLSAPDITDGDIAAVTAVLRSGWLSLGPKLREFEEAFARYLGVRHAIACNSGTSALHMIMLAGGVKAGDEVLTSPFSFIASANCIEMVGAKPVFVDIDPVSLNMDPAKLAAACTPRTKAILSVHIFGLSAAAKEIADFARERRLPVFEDACESLGATAYGRKVGDGTYGQASAWAFYPNKQMTTGEGGVVTTNDDGLAATISKLRNQGRAPGSAWLEHDTLGYNYRLDEMSCALGASQLARLDDILGRRDAVAKRYHEKLGRLGEYVELLHVPPGWTRSWFVYVVVLRKGWSRDKMADELTARGIQCNKYFSPPIHLQNFYRTKYGYKTSTFPVTEDIARRTLALPFHTNVANADIDEVCGVLEDVFHKTPDRVRA